MLSFDRSDGHFHLRTVAVCMRHDALLIHQAVGDTMWSLPGGRVEMGETSETALVREMDEELQTRVLNPVLRGVIEVIDGAAHGRVFHEIGFYYAVDLCDVPWQPQVFRGPEVSNPVDFWWCPRAQLDAVVLLPTPVRMVLDATNVQHLVYNHYCT